MIYPTGSVRQFGRLGRFAGLPVFCIFVGLILAACGRPAVDYAALLTQAETHISKLEWDEAIPDLKRYLLANPHDGRAHFQLGRCYLNGNLLVPYVAEGEFRIALDAYEKNGRKSLFQDNTDQFFPVRCHLEIAKIYMKIFMQGAEHDLPRNILEETLKKMRSSADAARALDAANPDVAELYKIIETFSHSMETLQSPVQDGVVTDLPKQNKTFF